MCWISICTTQQPAVLGFMRLYHTVQSFRKGHFLQVRNPVLSVVFFQFLDEFESILLPISCLFSYSIMLLCSRLLLGQFQVIRREQEEQLTGKCSLLSLKVLVGRYLQQFKHRQIRLMISQCNILMCFLTDFPLCSPTFTSGRWIRQRTQLRPD